MFFIVVFKSFHYDLRQMHKEIAYVVVASAMTFSYWIIVATPVFATFMNKGTMLQSYGVVAVFYMLFFGLLLGIAAVKKYRSLWVKRIQIAFTFNPAHSRKRAVLLFTAALVFLLCAEVVFLFVNFPVSGLRMKPLSIVYSIPMLVFVGFGCMGLEYLEHVENRWFFQAWLCAILMSFLYSLITVNTTLFPDRHVEYLIVPTCLFVAVGVVHFFKKRELKIPFPLTKQFSSPWIQGLFVVVVSGLVFSNAVAVYPVYHSLEWMDESIPDSTVNAIRWIKENLDGNHTVVATDLRLSKMLWAEGINSTFEGTNETWSCAAWQDCVPEFQPEGNHSLVTYVLIDDVMRDTSVNVRVQWSAYMNNDSYLKFHVEPFELLYRNATVNQNLEEVHWAEVYAVNWTYIHR
jgi:hypothetical protein